MCSARAAYWTTDSTDRSRRQIEAGAGLVADLGRYAEPVALIGHAPLVPCHGRWRTVVFARRLPSRRLSSDRAADLPSRDRQFCWAAAQRSQVQVGTLLLPCHWSALRRTHQTSHAQRGFVLAAADLGDADRAGQPDHDLYHERSEAFVEWLILEYRGNHTLCQEPYAETGQTAVERELGEPKESAPAPGWHELLTALRGSQRSLFRVVRLRPGACCSTTFARHSLRR